MVIVTKFYIPDTNYFNEEDVIVPHKFEEQAKLEGRVTDKQINHELEKEQRAAELADGAGGNPEITPA
jgi:hypothetical protein